MISTEMMKNRIQAPEGRTANGVFQGYIDDFMLTDNMTMKLNCSNEEEAKRCYNAMVYARKRKNYNITIWKRNCGVYVIKG